MYGLPGVIAFKGYPNIEAYELLFGPLKDTMQYVMTEQDLEDVVTRRCGPEVWSILRPSEPEEETNPDTDLDSAHEEIHYWQDTARESAEALKKLSESIRERQRFTAAAKEKMLTDIESIVDLLEKEL